MSGLKLIVGAGKLAARMQTLEGSLGVVGKILLSVLTVCAVALERAAGRAWQ